MMVSLFFLMALVEPICIILGVVYATLITLLTVLYIQEKNKQKKLIKEIEDDICNQTGLTREQIFGKEKKVVEDDHKKT